MIVLGVWMYLELAYAIAIGTVIFFGLKGITVNRKASMEKQAGDGFCAECGEQVIKGKCPSCNSSQNDE